MEIKINVEYTYEKRTNFRKKKNMKINLRITVAKI